MATLTEQIAALRSEQRARVDRIRIDGTGNVAVGWMGMGEVVDPSRYVSGDLPDNVSVTVSLKPEDLALRLDGAADPAAELSDLSESGIIGDVVVERLGAPDVVRWRAQAWVGINGKALAVDDDRSSVAGVLAAEADRRLARWRLTQAEQALTDRVREALSDGVKAPLLAAGIGVSRARVYQLRDGRR